MKKQLLILLALSTLSCQQNDNTNQLTPHGNAVPLTSFSSQYIYPPNQSLSLKALNQKGMVAKSGIKSTSPNDYFTAKSIITGKALFTGLADFIESQGDSQKAQGLRLIAASVKEQIIFRRPAHQYKINRKLANRIIFYGADNEFDHGPGHKHIDKLAHAINMPLIKVMTHFEDAQGGDLFQLLENGVGGMTHAGGYYPGWNNNKPIAVLSDWPADYGVLGDDNVDYNAHILAIDYQAATEKYIPVQTLKAYHHNFALWDVFTGLVIPFTKKAKVEEYQDYKNNPLEVYDDASLKALAKTASQFDKNKVKFTSYCSEGQWNVMNLAPTYLITKGKYPALDKVITAFQAAPEYKGLTQQERFKNPQFGWKWLLQEKVITKEQYKNVYTSRRIGVYLDWINANTKKLSHYKPKSSNDLVIKPMSLSVLVRTLLRIYFPREAVAEAVKTELLRVYALRNATTNAAINAFLMGHSPDTKIGKNILTELSFKIASMQLSLLLQSDTFKKVVFSKLGYQHIVYDKDKQNVNQLYAKYIATTMDERFKERDDFDKALDQLDSEFSQLEVTMHTYGPKDIKNRTKKEKVKFFLWAPPQAWAFWAQYPTLFNSGIIRYVTTAIHYNHSIAMNKAEQN